MGVWFVTVTLLQRKHKLDNTTPHHGYSRPPNAHWLVVSCASMTSPALARPASSCGVRALFVQGVRVWRQIHVHDHHLQPGRAVRTGHLGVAQLCTRERWVMRRPRDDHPHQSLSIRSRIMQLNAIAMKKVVARVQGHSDTGVLTIK